MVSHLIVTGLPPAWGPPAASSQVALGPAPSAPEHGLDPDDPLVAPVLRSACVAYITQNVDLQVYIGIIIRQKSGNSPSSKIRQTEIGNWKSINDTRQELMRALAYGSGTDSCTNHARKELMRMLSVRISSLLVCSACASETK